MRKASLWMFLLAVLVLPTTAAAEDFQLQFLPEEQNAAEEAPAPCSSDPSLASIFAPMQQADLKATYSSSSASGCCSMFGCCTHIQSGCEQCSGGRRWYSIYSCGNGWTCKVNPSSCPTAC